MGKTDVAFGLSVALNAADAKAIDARVPSNRPLTDKLGEIAGGLLTDLARGGTMIPPEWASRIESAIGSTDPAAIVDHVEKSVNRAGASTRIEWIPDPTQIAWYQPLADNAGITLEMQLKSIMDFAYEQGYFGQNAPDPFKVLLSPEQYRILQKMFGRDIVTGEDIMDVLQKDVHAEIGPADEEDDLIMESLAEAKK